MKKISTSNKLNFYQKRTDKLLASSYPVELIDVNFSKPHTKCINLHKHDEIEFIYVVEGNSLITCEDNQITAAKGDIIFINKNILHFLTSDDNKTTQTYSLIVHPSFIFGLSQLELEKKYLDPIVYNNSFKYLHIKPEDDKYDAYSSCLRELIDLQRKQPLCYELMSKSLFLKLWSYIYENLVHMKKLTNETYTSSNDELRVKQAIIFIQNHYNETITLDDIASSILVSKSECCRCFKRVMNITPFEFLMKHRIMQSVKRMSEMPHESISQIASEAGFNNTSYYNKLFKKYMDCTPTQYRKSIKNISTAAGI